MKDIFLKGHKHQTPVEELINSFTHFIGAMLGIAGLVILTVMSARQGSALKVVSSVIFGSSLIIMYLSSAIYHAVRQPKVKLFFKVMDHTAIYLLIAGTYTPVVLVSLGGAWGWSLFGVIWGLALLGLIFKVFATGKMELVSVFAYIGMGWLALIAIKKIYLSLTLPGFAWLLIGGVSYTLGVIFYAWDELRFGHAIWHLFVLGGSICHFFLIMLYVIPLGN